MLHVRLLWMPAVSNQRLPAVPAHAEGRLLWPPSTQVEDRRRRTRTRTRKHRRRRQRKRERKCRLPCSTPAPQRSRSSAGGRGGCLPCRRTRVAPARWRQGRQRGTPRSPLLHRRRCCCCYRCRCCCRCRRCCLPRRCCGWPSPPPRRIARWPSTRLRCASHSPRQGQTRCTAPRHTPGRRTPARSSARWSCSRRGLGSWR